jgi:hypothetical protein
METHSLRGVRVRNVIVVETSILVHRENVTQKQGNVLIVSIIQPVISARHASLNSSATPATKHAESVYVKTSVPILQNPVFVMPCPDSVRV